MAAYTDATAVATYLGRDLLPAEATAVTTTWAPAATTAIDAAVGRSWQAAVILGEWLPVYSGRGRLRATPVVSVEAVRWRAPVPGSATTAGTALDGYELLDPAAGLLVLGPGLGGAYVTVDYTTDGTVPPAVAEAATRLAARSLESGPAAAAAADGGDAWLPPEIKSYSVGGELTVERFGPGEGPSSTYAAAGFPPDVAALLAPWLGAVVFA